MAGMATTDQDIHRLFRQCALAVLNTDGDQDDARQVYELYRDFDIRVVPESRGVKLELYNSPGQAFVDGKVIQGIRSHLFSALRDIVFTHNKLAAREFDLESAAGLTDTVFRILRNAGVVGNVVVAGIGEVYVGFTRENLTNSHTKRNVG
jgi:hypothetical protein